MRCGQRRPSTSRSRSRRERSASPAETETATPSLAAIASELRQLQARLVAPPAPTCSSLAVLPEPHAALSPIGLPPDQTQTPCQGPAPLSPASGIGQPTATTSPSTGFVYPSPFQESQLSSAPSTATAAPLWSSTAVSGLSASTIANIQQGGFVSFSSLLTELAADRPHSQVHLSRRCIASTGYLSVLSASRLELTQ